MKKWAEVTVGGRQAGGRDEESDILPSYLIVLSLGRSFAKTAAVDGLAGVGADRILIVLRVR